MPIYRIEVVETKRRFYEVEADTRDDAIICVKTFPDSPDLLQDESVEAYRIDHVYPPYPVVQS